MGAESEERQQQVVCSRAGDETGGLGLEERRENEDLKLAYLLHQPPGFFITSLAGVFSGNAFWSWGLG